MLIADGLSVFLEQLIDLLLLMFSSFIFSASEGALMRVNRFKVEVDARNKLFARFTLKLTKRLDHVLSVLLLGNTLAGILIGGKIAEIVSNDSLPEIVTYLTPVIVTIGLLLFSELFPKTLGARYPQRIAYATSPLVWIMMTLLYPIIYIVGIMNNKLMQLLGLSVTHTHEIISRDEYKLMLSEGMQYQQQYHLPLMLGIIELAETSVNDIMIPTSKIQFLNLDDSKEELNRQISTCQHELMPVIEHDVDNVIGVVLVRDLIQTVVQNKDCKAAVLAYMRIPYFIQEKTTLPQQLENFTLEGQKLALIVNEYGSLMGLLSMSDILKEIFINEIPPSKKNTFEETEAGVWMISGQMSLHHLRRFLNWQFPASQARTLGGFLIEQLECIPQAGACLLIQGLIFEILQVSSHRIVKVKVKRHDQDIK